MAHTHQRGECEGTQSPHLYTHVLQVVFSFLRFGELPSLMQTCRDWYVAVDTDQRRTDEIHIGASNLFTVFVHSPLRRHVSRIEGRRHWASWNYDFDSNWIRDPRDVDICTFATKMTALMSYFGPLNIRMHALPMNLTQLDLAAIVLPFMYDDLADEWNTFSNALVSLRKLRNLSMYRLPDELLRICPAWASFLSRMTELEILGIFIAPKDLVTCKTVRSLSSLTALGITGIVNDYVLRASFLNPSLPPDTLTRLRSFDLLLPHRMSVMHLLEEVRVERG